jgi:TatD DNase family protein
MRFIDTHAHVTDEQFDGDRAAVLDRAWAAGLDVVVEIGESEGQWAKARTLAETHPGRVFWAVGFHPYYADQADSSLSGRVTAALAHPQAVALGEIGLDYFRNTVPPDVQRRAFADLAAVAVAVDKPLILHCRESSLESVAAQQDMLGGLRPLFSERRSSEFPAGVAHCFQGRPDLAREFLELGFMIGVDAPLTYPKAGALRELIRDIPLDRLVLETDCPYLPPQALRGRRNEPSHLPAVAEALAVLKGVSTDEVARVTSDNARRLYRLPR